MNRHYFENRLMDVLQDYPHTASDLAERLVIHVDSVHRCLRSLHERGLVEPAGNIRRTSIWRMTRTRRAVVA